MNKTIKNSIDTFVKADGKMNERLHILLMTLMSHSKQHVDCSGFAYLLTQLNKGRRKGAIMHWVTKYAPIKFSLAADGETYTAKFTKKSKNWGEDDWLLELAEANPYWQKEDTEAKQQLLTYEKALGMILSLAKRLEGQEIEGEDNPKVTHLVTALKQVA